MNKIIDYKQRKMLQGKSTENNAILIQDEIPAYREAFDLLANKTFEYPDKFTGKGIVICGGGVKYFPCAYVCISMLRMTGCDLPIDVWALGKHEFDDKMEKILNSLGAKFVNALDYLEDFPTPHLHGWSLKAYAIMNCRFKEVLFLDSDNFPIKDPAYLFDEKDYKNTGAIFWPDYGRLAEDRKIWSICGVPYNDEPEFETGQMLIDKSKCWKELNITHWMNTHSDFFYEFIWGDKETFHMAWRRTGKKYTMVSRPIFKLPENDNSLVMCQHDLDGQRLFQHRNIKKWSLSEGNPIIPGFKHEDLGFSSLIELSKQWDNKISVDIKTKVDTIKTLIKNVKRFRVRINNQANIYFVTLNEDLSMTSDIPVYNGTWNVKMQDQTPILEISTKRKSISNLKQQRDGKWIGLANTPTHDKIVFIPSPQI